MTPRHLNKQVQSINKRALLLALSLCLVFTAIVGGTYAWLFIKGTGSATASFAGTHVTLSFGNGSETQIMVPGEYVSIPGNTVKAGSQACYVFCRLDKGNATNFNKCMTYTPNSNWALHKGNTSSDQVLYYCFTQSAVTSDTGCNLFKNNQISVRTDVTKETIASTSFTFSVTYCAVQQAAHANAAAAFARTGW